MTIAFLSLFFGLITGSYPVELSVNGPVAAVEILLDGQAAARLNGPPWKTEVDFGRDLLPRHVVARALDASGQEIGRVQAWANLPNSEAKAEILTEGDPGTPPRAARIVWTHLKGRKPASMNLSFDGAALALDGEGRATLPAHDLKTPHVVTAEVHFSPLEILRRDIAYGGEFGSEVSTELTAVPVRLRQGKMPPADKLDGWFASAGRPLPVIAVEEGPAQLLVVRSPDAKEISGRLGTSGIRANNPRRQKLGDGQTIRFLSPHPLRFETSEWLTDIFDVSPGFTVRMGGFVQLLESIHRRIQPGEQVVPGKRIADAVAAAGIVAINENRRRAVLLVISGDEKDESRRDPATVRKFLEAIRVPLFVWCLRKPAPDSPLAAWGECTDAKIAQTLTLAIEEIRRELDSQRIVLLDGRHLPQSIALTPVAGPVELVGGADR
ncbi:MAG TPA: hypothetical protein VG477_07210 [Thermoanaerobaculia bacterium]|nr:hypothetical protein [Thermoanaerobaculia bacterium]